MVTSLGKCLVTGASGFVGRVLCEQLAIEKERQPQLSIRALLRNDQPGPWDEAVLCDLNDFESRAKQIFQDVDTIFYLSSIAHNKAEVSEYYAFNVDLCERFAKCALEQGVKRFIYVSSSKAVAEAEDRVIDENFSEQPLDDYGLSKRAAEEILLGLEGFDQLVILRPCLIYGAGIQANLYTMIHWIDRDIFPPLPDTGAKRSMISVRDVARALIAVAITKESHRKVYFVTDNNSYSIKEIENSIRKKLGHHIFSWSIPYSLLYFLSKIGDVINYFGVPFPLNSESLGKLLGAAQYASQKIQEDTGWKPLETFYSVLPEILSTYRKEQEVLR